LGPLHRTLAKCGVAADQILSVAERLRKPCLSFAQSALTDPATFFPGGSEIYPDPITGVWEATPRRFDPGVAARMLQLHEGRPDLKREWKPSRADWRRARRLWNWTGEAHGLRVTPQQGRRPRSDAALVLYCARILCEATGESHFRFSRSESNSGGPNGPTWQALIEALPLAQSFLALCYPGYATLVDGQIHAETIAEIITLTRLKRFDGRRMVPTLFDDWCRALYLEPSADDVASQPQMYRVVIAYTRARLPAPKWPSALPAEVAARNADGADDKKIVRPGFFPILTRHTL
jgi:hypothetical protein